MERLERMKIIIKNRKKQRIVVLVENPEGKELAVIMHGLGGNKEQLHIKKFAESFKNKNFVTITFDTTNTYGESDGKYEKATITSYYEDLEDVISWAKKQKWYKEPFWLAAHSLGGICILLYTQRHPEELRGIAPISTVVSGKLTFQSQNGKKWREWKKTGWNVYKSASGKIKRLPWSHYEDRLKYDILKNPKKIKTPTLLIVGSEDGSTPVEHNKKLFNSLKCEKEFHIIKGAPHTFIDKKHLIQIKKIFDRWIEKVMKNGRDKP